MRNRFHLLVETPNANLVAGMRWLLSAHTLRLNHRHKLFGHVFSGRDKAISAEALRHGVSANRVRLCAFKSGPRQTDRPPRAVAGLSLMRSVNGKSFVRKHPQNDYVIVCPVY